MKHENSMQKRLREATEKTLETFGFSYYNNGELRPPPMTCVDAAQQALVDTAEERICGGSALAQTDAQLLSDLYKNGMVSLEAMQVALGLVVADGTKKETEPLLGQQEKT